MQKSQAHREVHITINGLKVYYQIAGSGPALLILHGWGSKSDRWTKVSELLSNQGFSVIVPDLPGFGKSEQPKSSFFFSGIHLAGD